MTSDKEEFNADMSWFYPNVISGIKLGEVSNITASQGTGKSIFDKMTRYEIKEYINNLYGSVSRQSSKLDRGNG